MSQQGFQITPAESCVQPLPDVCDAASGWLHVHNGCADALTIDYASTGKTVSLVSDATTATIAPGDTDQFNVGPFSSGSHVHITADLGSTAIVIDYDVVPD